MRREIADLTICRAIFAGFVFAYHVDLHAQFGGGWLRRGYLGVDGFFLLSGLILALVHPELKLTDSGRFWVRRLARIYPVHLAVILLLVVVVGGGLALGVHPRDPGRFTLPALAENLLVIHGWGVGDLAWNYPSWSVSTEWAGYLMFPLLWWGMRKLPVALAGLAPWLCLVALCLLDVWSPHGLNLTFSSALLRFFPEFCAGMATARLLPVVAGRVSGLGLAMAGAALALLGPHDWMVVAGLWALLAGIMLRAEAGQAGLLPNWRVLRFLGRLSYAFYMSFGSVELFLAQLYRHEGWDPAAGKLAYAAAFTVLTFVLAVILHWGVENPVRLAVDRYLDQPREAAKSLFGSFSSEKEHPLA